MAGMLYFPTIMIRRLNIRNLLAFVILVLAGALTVTVIRNFQGPSPEEALEYGIIDEILDGREFPPLRD